MYKLAFRINKIQCDVKGCVDLKGRFPMETRYRKVLFALCAEILQTEKRRPPPF